MSSIKIFNCWNPCCRGALSKGVVPLSVFDRLRISQSCSCLRRGVDLREIAPEAHDASTHLWRRLEPDSEPPCRKLRVRMRRDDGFLMLDESVLDEP
ncbi:MAG TPA: hypothetical protein VMV10_14235 [Pirellulales bacterium]|nr:hypothetical protein [Pirellulales bacterium]